MSKSRRTPVGSITDFTVNVSARPPRELPRSDSPENIKRRRLAAADFVLCHIRGALNVDGARLLEWFSEACDEEWRDPTLDDDVVALALAHLVRHGCGLGRPKEERCAGVRCVLILVYAAHTLVDRPDLDAVGDGIAEFSEGLLRASKRLEEIIADRWSRLSSPRREQEEDQRVREDAFKVLVAARVAQEAASAFASRWGLPRGLNYGQRGAPEGRAPLIDAERVLHLGGWPDDKIARLIADVRPGNESEPTQRVKSRRKQPAQIPGFRVIG